MTAPTLFALPQPRAGRSPRERRIALAAVVAGLEAELDVCLDLADERRDEAPVVSEYFERRADRVVARLAACKRRLEELR